MTIILNIHVTCEKSLLSYFENFYHYVASVLKDKRGWKQAGLKFVFVKTEKEADLHIQLTRNSTIEQKCNFSLLSCAFMDGSRRCFINFTRWLHGSKKSHLSLHSYRIYVIGHEIGHILGLEHAECACQIKNDKNSTNKNKNSLLCDKNTPAPLMLPQTLGTHACKGNSWPLQEEIKKVQILWKQKQSLSSLNKK